MVFMGAIAIRLPSLPTKEEEGAVKLPNLAPRSAKLTPQTKFSCVRSVKTTGKH